VTSSILELQTELTRLIAFRPVTDDVSSTLAVLHYVSSELEALGLQTVIKTNKGFPALIAGTQSLSRSTVLLQAHIDVVPAEEPLFTPVIKEHIMTGRGTYDMLFGTAAFLVALRSLHADGKLAKLDVGVMLTSDEEVGGHAGVGHFITDYDCDVCILPDAGLEGVLSEASKGVLEVEIIIPGIAGHAAEPHKYDNPMYRTGEIITMLHERFPNTDPDQTTYSLTKIHGGEALNQTPHHVSLCMDMRYVPSDDPNEIQQVITDLVKPFGAIVKQLVCEPPFQLEVTHKHVQAFAKLYESIAGTAVTFMTSKGSSDARFMSLKNIPVIMTRPVGGGLHAPTEHVDLESLARFTDLISRYIQQTA
jgi:succinyl-diaminopimelate desuccinylase